MTKIQTQLAPQVFEEVEDIHIPDLWGLAMWLKDSDARRTNDPTPSHNRDVWLKAYGEDVLKCWHLCHSLLDHIIRQEAKQAREGKP